jgi:myo-inositol-1(or 4)-monophosphatase
MNLENLCLQVCELARETGNFIKTEAEKITREKVEVKGLNNFVTYVDKTAEQKIVSALQQFLPEAGFITEEGTAKENGSKYRWVIDPLDGTTNFIHGLPPFAISIGLMEDQEVILGVVYEVNLSECFYAWKGSKAYLNGKEIQVSAAARIEDSLIATGFPYYDYSRVKPFFESLDYFFHNSHGVRRLGSAATDMAYVACGRFEAFYEYSLSPWDVAAGAIIVKQAGGKVSDFKGGENYIFGKEIIVTNNNVYQPFLNYINKQFCS